MRQSETLENRLIDFGVAVAELVRKLPEDRISFHLGGQLLRSGTSAALNYGEARGAESRKDFIHKLGIILKELRETGNCLRILSRTHPISNIDTILTECNELIAIFVKSVNTVKSRL